MSCLSCERDRTHSDQMTTFYIAPSSVSSSSDIWQSCAVDLIYPSLLVSLVCRGVSLPPSEAFSSWILPEFDCQIFPKSTDIEFVRSGGCKEIIALFGVDFARYFQKFTRFLLPEYSLDKESS